MIAALTHLTAGQAVVAWMLGAGAILAAIHKTVKDSRAAEQELRRREVERANA